MSEREPSVAQIHEAGNTLFQIDQGFLVDSDIEQRKANASQVLRTAGPDNVKKALKEGGLQNVDSGFWASDQEREDARTIVLKFIKQGWISTRSFEVFGLETHIEGVATNTSISLPELTVNERARLFKDISTTIRDSIIESGESFPVALRRIY